VAGYLAASRPANYHADWCSQIEHQEVTRLGSIRCADAAEFLL